MSRRLVIRTLIALCIAVGLGTIDSDVVRADALHNGTNMSFSSRLYSSNGSNFLYHQCHQIPIQGPTRCYVRWWNGGTSACGHADWISWWDGDCNSIGSHADQWANGDANNWLAMQTDGNLVLYNSGNSAIWETNTDGYGSGTFLNAQDDGNLVVYYNTNVAIWAVY